MQLAKPEGMRVLTSAGLVGILPAATPMSISPARLGLSGKTARAGSGGHRCRPAPVQQPRPTEASSRAAAEQRAGRATGVVARDSSDVPAGTALALPVADIPVT